MADQVVPSTTVTSKPARCADIASRLLVPPCTVLSRISAFFAAAPVERNRTAENITQIGERTRDARATGSSICEQCVLLLSRERVIRSIRPYPRRGDQRT